MRNLILVIVSFALFSQHVRAEFYVIHGRVLNARGDEVSGANIQALELQVSRIVRPSTISKKDGSFELKNLEPGKYRLYSWKDSEGVPDITGVLFRRVGQQFPEITVGAKMSNAEVTLKLPAPYGSVSGLVEDAETHIPITKARISLEWSGRPDVMYEGDGQTDGKFFLQLPDRPIKFSVSSPGYEPWIYRNGVGNDNIVLSADAKVNIIIGLQKAKAAKKVSVTTP